MVFSIMSEPLNEDLIDRLVINLRTYNIGEIVKINSKDQKPISIKWESGSVRRYRRDDNKIEFR